MKRHYVRTTLAAVLALFLLLFQFAHAEDIKLKLQTMEDFHSAELAAARKPVLTQDEEYRDKLTKLQKSFQDAGNLNGVLAATLAIDNLDSGTPITPSEQSELAAIQKTYSTARKKADADFNKAQASINQAYLESIRKLVADLTKKGEIEQALEAQAMVDRFVKEDATAKPLAEQTQDDWKKKALAEFPELSDPNSPLSKRVQSLKESKKTQPSYFQNPQWPYLITQEADKSIRAEGLITRFNGFFLNTDDVICFPFFVEQDGTVNGAQFNLQKGEGPEITGKRDGDKIVTKWSALGTGKPHEFTFTLSPDGDLIMDGKHGFNLESRHKETMRRVTDPDKCKRISKQISDSTSSKEIKKLVSKLAPP